MKHLTVLSFFILLLSACSTKAPSDKTQQLADLQAEQTKLNQQITTLQNELGVKAGDTSNKQSHRETPVALSEIKPTSFSHFLEIQGKVDALDNIGVSTKMPGIITAVFVVKGQQVKKGTLLATLDDAVFQQSVQELQNSLDFARTIYDKQKGLWDKQIGTEVQYLQAKNQVESLEKKLATLNQQSELYKVYSPLAGTVDEVNIKPGEGIAVGMPAFRVVSLSNLRVLVDIAESYYKDIKTGDAVEVIFPDLNKSVNASVKAKSNIINNLNRTFRAEIRLPANTDARPNMIANVKLKNYMAGNALVVPVNVIQNSEEGDYVFVADKDTNGNSVAHKRIVTTGKIYGSGAEILSGLKTGEKIITNGYQDLVNGQTIKF